jgi:zinc D-Ala-D-Ala carboxypeptidase
MIDKISSNITYKEATFSETAIRMDIDNTPDDEQLKAMKLVADNVFQPLREHFCVRIYISSFFRSKALNSALNGSLTSSHMKGQAIDVDADVYNEITNADIFAYINENLSFDQLIWEYGTDLQPNWVHVSFVSKAENRNQVLKCIKVNGKTEYRTL